VRRLAPVFLAVLVLLGLAGCDWSKPGGETVSAAPDEVVGTVPEQKKVEVPQQFAKGDPEAGKDVFASAGCNGCHTLEAAGASGTVGPNLDQAKPDLALIVERVRKGMGGMPSFEGRLSTKDIANVAAFVYASTHGTG
jgi:mono/diheme cytochrome c family protein